MVEVLALGALGLCTYAAISRRTAGTALTAPVFFTGLGVLMHVLLGGHADLHVQADWVHLVAEITLVVVLFTDASRIDLRHLRRDRALPMRLLGIGLPLTIGFGALAAAWLFSSMDWWQAGLVGAILAPTDAALGQAVFGNERVPERIRQTLNVESGLNDGIALPAVLAFVYAVEAEHAEAAAAGYWVQFVSMQLLLGPVTGIAVGWLGGQLVARSRRAGWMTDTFEQVSAIGIALLAFAGAETIGGNGFLAAFVAGLTLGNTARGISERLGDFGETEGQLLSLVTFTTFGALMVPLAFEHLDATIVLYAVLSLTLVRGLAVAVGLLGAGLGATTVAFVAWFGPRGVASLLFGLILIERSSMPAVEHVLAIVTTTVLLSVVLHGATAAPLARRYGDRRAADR